MLLCTTIPGNPQAQLHPLPVYRQHRKVSGSKLNEFSRFIQDIRVPQLSTFPPLPDTQERAGADLTGLVGLPD